MKIVNPNSAVFVIILEVFAEKIVQRPKQPERDFQTSPSTLATNRV
jgi:hypothetical protein